MRIVETETTLTPPGMILRFQGAEDLETGRIRTEYISDRDICELRHPLEESVAVRLLGRILGEKSRSSR